MRIGLQNLTPEGVELAQTFTAAELGVDPEVLVARSPIYVGAFAYRAGKTVIVEVSVKGNFELTCARCLTVFEEEKTFSFELYYETGKNQQVIEPDEDIRQELVMMFSFVPVCREDCKGICPKCGANLDKELCRCRDTEHKNT